MSEPTVLDYVKAKITFWRPSDLHFPEAEWIEEQELADDVLIEQSEIRAVFVSGYSPRAIPAQPTGTAAEFGEIAGEIDHGGVTDLVETTRLAAAGVFPWRAMLALLAALVAQVSLNGPERAASTGFLFYGLAAALVIWGVWKSEWSLAPLRAAEVSSQPIVIRPNWLAFGLPLMLLTFLVFSPGIFTPITVIIWLLTILVIVGAFWAPRSAGSKSWFQRLVHFHWKPKLTPFTALVIGATLVVVFFRIYQINQVPPEMVSDHAEKLLDVNDVLNGHTAVFFPRNTGREFFQFYLTAAIILIFKTGISFLSLKIGTIFMGLITLPFIYLIGKEVANRRVGLIALFFAGIAYWPNVITRIALRFTLYPAFTAPALYFLLRGLRRRKRNDFILSGLFLGLGLHGYTSFRIVPLVVLAVVGLYLLHRSSKGDRWQATANLSILALVSFAVFLPLFRYATLNPEMFAYRTLTRVGTLEHPIPGSPIAIFFSNLWNASTMFFWSGGDVWVHSIPFRPALDTVSAGLFFLGVVLVVVRYIRQRNWTDIALLCSIPLLMLPSILSIAFPNENPSLNRTAGAVVPVFVILGLGFEALYVSLKERVGGSWGKVSAWAVALLLVVFSAQQNYQLAFVDYATQYKNAAWNSSEMGQVIKNFTQSIGSQSQAWVVAYPYWVDTRLVGINAGYPTWDTAINPDQIPGTLAISAPKLFIVNMQDTQALSILKSTYPAGVLSKYASQVPSKDFYIYLVPDGK